MTDTQAIKALLVDRLEQLAAELVPDGSRSGHYWIGRCPWRGDRSAGSFWVNLAGAKVPGSFKDAASGEKGDVLTLIQKACGLADFRATMDWSRSWLGISADMTGDDRRRLAERQRLEAARREADHAAKIGQDRARAASLFRASKSRPFLGSPADLYLQGRGIDVRRLGRMPGVLGWLPDARHVETGLSFPVMVAGMQDAARQIVAVHRTFVAPDGAGKAPLGCDARGREHKARKVWPGELSGAVIRLWRGGSGLDEREAARHGVLDTLVLVEGVEDGLAVALSRPDARVWCAYSLGNLAHVRLPACCDEVIVCADNDWGKPQAQRAFKDALSALTAQGRPVSVARSPIGKDVNDCLRGMPDA